MKTTSTQLRFAFALLVFSFLFSECTIAQDPVYLGTAINDPLLNPAFTGSSQQHRLLLQYQSMYFSVPGSPRNTNLQYDGFVRIGNQKIGLGFDGSWQKVAEGTMTRSDYNIRLGYTIPFGPDRKNGELMIGATYGVVGASFAQMYMQYRGYEVQPLFSSRWQDYPYPYQIPLAYKWTWNSSAGISYVNKNTFVAFSILNLRQPRFDDYYLNTPMPTAQLGRNITFQAGHRIAFGKDKNNSVMISGMSQFQNLRIDHRVRGDVDIDGVRLMGGVMLRDYVYDSLGDASGVMFFLGTGYSLKDRVVATFTYSYFAANKANMISGPIWDLGLQFNLTKPKDDGILERPWR